MPQMPLAEPFDAACVLYSGKSSDRRPCRVVGVQPNATNLRLDLLVLVRGDDGSVRAEAVDEVVDVDWPLSG